MAENFANAPTTVLAAGINASVTSLSVSSSAGFPAANFRIRIDDEILLVTGVSGTTWTVTRGAESSTAATHATMAEVRHILTAGGLVAALADITKLAAGGTANRVLATADGSTMAMQQVVAAMIANGTITATQIATDTITASQLAPDCVGASELADSSVATANIIADSVTQSASAVGTTSSPTTTSTSPVQLAEMSVALTTTGAPVVVDFNGSFFGSGNINILLSLYMDGVTQSISRVVSTPNSTTYVIGTLRHRFTPSAGSHTFQIYWSVNSGTATAESTSRSVTVIELKK